MAQPTSHTVKVDFYSATEAHKFFASLDNKSTQLKEAFSNQIQPSHNFAEEVENQARNKVLEILAKHITDPLGRATLAFKENAKELLQRTIEYKNTGGSFESDPIIVADGLLLINQELPDIAEAFNKKLSEESTKLKILYGQLEIDPRVHPELASLHADTAIFQTNLLATYGMTDATNEEKANLLRAECENAINALANTYQQKEIIQKSETIAKSCKEEEFTRALHWSLWLEDQRKNNPIGYDQAKANAYKRINPQELTTTANLNELPDASIKPEDFSKIVIQPGSGHPPEVVVSLKAGENIMHFEWDSPIYKYTPSEVRRKSGVNYDHTAMRSIEFYKAQGYKAIEATFHGPEAKDIARAFWKRAKLEGIEAEISYIDEKGSKKTYQHTVAEQESISKTIAERKAREETMKQSLESSESFKKKRETITEKAKSQMDIQNIDDNIGVRPLNTGPG